MANIFVGNSGLGRGKKKRTELQSRAAKHDRSDEFMSMQDHVLPAPKKSRRATEKQAKNQSTCVFTGGVLIGDDAVKPYIPYVWRYFLDFLACKRNTDEFRVQPVLSVSQEGKTAIKITATHPDSIVVVVECNGRRYHNVQVAWLYRRSVQRLPDAVTISLEGRFRPNLKERHFASLAQNGRENALVCAPATIEDFQGVDLVTRWQIACNGFARSELSRAHDALANDCGGPQARIWLHLASRT